MAAPKPSEPDYETNRPVVLILAYEYAPFVSIAVQRPGSWFAYFHEFGLYPVVVTRHWDREMHSEADYLKASLNQEIQVERGPEGTIVRAPFKPNWRDRLMVRRDYTPWKQLRRGLTAAHLIADFYTNRFDSQAALYFAAKDYMKHHRVSLITATGGPFILFQYAHQLSVEFQVPWLADYRDGWTTHEVKRGQRSLIDRWFTRRKERGLLQTASAVTAAAPSYAGEIHSLSGREVAVIYNGYREEQFPKPAPPPPADSSRLRITYAGSLYDHQPLELFIRGAGLFHRRHPETALELHFLGLGFVARQRERVEQAAAEQGLSARITGKIPHDTVIDQLYQSDMLLLLTRKRYSWLYAKVFDYIASGRPLLVVENDEDVIQALLTELGKGDFCDSEEQIADAMERRLKIKRSGQPEPHDDEAIRRYSRRYQAGRMAELIHPLVSWDKERI